MRNLKPLALAASLSLAAGPTAATSVPTTTPTEAPAPKYSKETLTALRKTIWQVEHMPESERLQARAWRHRLEVLNVLWEDTGRYEGSSVGPNISDVTLLLRAPTNAAGTRTREHLLPVLRAPNFTDKTADLPADSLWVKVGNQSAGAQLVTVPLSEVLKNIREYVSDADSIKGSGDLSAPRDTHYLVSAQHVFVPIPDEGKIEFTPVIFNYQSSHRSPAVLTLLVTRQGTSVAAIDYGDGATPDGAQRLYFNNKGQKTTLTAERKSVVKERIESGNATAQDEGALDEGADMMMIVQVPLKVRRPSSFGMGYGYGVGGLGLFGTGAGGSGSGPMPAPVMPSMSAKKESLSGAALGDAVASRGRSSDVEQAVLGYGEDLGDFSEGRGMRLERDARFPVRVTVQFYKATSNGVVSDDDLRAAKAEIDKVYAKADYTGSLVVAQGKRTRPTDWHLGHTQPVPVLTKTLVMPAPVELEADLGSDLGAAADEPAPSVVSHVKAWLFG